MGKKRKTVGFAFSSGAFKGIAYIGILRTLVKHDIPIDYVAGSSAGAFVAAHYAMFQDVDRLEKVLAGSKKEKLFTLFEPSLGQGLIKGDRMGKLIEGWLDGAQFKDTKIPVNIVTTDLITGDEFVIDGGDLSLAVRASMSIPFVFKPVEYKNKVLIDGAICNPVPVNVVRGMGADVVIAVNLENYKGPGMFTKKDMKFTLISRRSVYLMLHHLAEIELRDADLVIEPKNSTRDMASWGKYFLNDETVEANIKAGEKAAEEMIPAIKKLIG